MVLGSHLEAVSTRAHQLEICSDLLVCSRTGPVRDGTVENRGRVGRRHDRYSPAEIANFSNLAYSSVNVLQFPEISFSFL